MDALVDRSGSLRNARLDGNVQRERQAWNRRDHLFRGRCYKQRKSESGLILLPRSAFQHFAKMYVLLCAKDFCDSQRK